MPILVQSKQEIGAIMRVIQKEMAETLKMYQKVLLGAEDAIIESKGGVVGKKSSFLLNTWNRNEIQTKGDLL